MRLRSGERTELHAQFAVNCTGVDVRYGSSTNRLIRSLLSQGLAVPGPHGRGLATGPLGQLITAGGFESEQLFAIGPPRFGSLFETTAVPELRWQTEALANHLNFKDTVPIEVHPDFYLAAGI